MMPTMTNLAKSTARPWKAVPDTTYNDGSWEVREVINDKGHYVLIAYGLPESKARLIAAAVNSYDEMLNALRGTLTIIDQISAQQPPEMQRGFAMWREQIVAAIIKATAEK